MKQIIISTSLLLLLLFTTSAVIVPAPVSWFREKYLTQTYNEYYIYTFSRLRLDDSDRDMCPELHKPAIYFAMTGQQLWRDTPQRYRARPRRQEQESMSGYTPPTAYDIRWIEITVIDVVRFLIIFVQYYCELLVLLLSVLMATLTTLILGILVFGQ